MMEPWKTKVIRSLFPYSWSRCRMEDAISVKASHIPSRLYKYRMFSNEHFDALARGILYASSAKLLNDPYEFSVFFHPGRLLVEDKSLDEMLKASQLPQLDPASRAQRPPKIERPIRSEELSRRIFSELYKGALDEKVKQISQFTKEIVVKYQRDLVKFLSDRLKEGFHALSLAENYWSVLMWTHYGDSHKGFCIEYDFDELPVNDIRRRMCFPVFYRRRLADATRYLAKSDFGQFNQFFPLYLILTKSDEWRYEREWRIIE